MSQLKDQINEWLETARDMAGTAGTIFQTGYGMYSTIHEGNTDQAATNFNQTMTNANTTSNNLATLTGWLKWLVPAVLGVFAFFLIRRH